MPNLTIFRLPAEPLTHRAIVFLQSHFFPQSRFSLRYKCMAANWMLAELSVIISAGTFVSYTCRNRIPNSNRRNVITCTFASYTCGNKILTLIEEIK